MSLSMSMELYVCVTLSLHDALPICEGRQRDPLIVPVHPPEVLLCQRERQKTVGLDVVQPQLRGIRGPRGLRSEEHTSELQSLTNIVCRLLLAKNNKQ